MRKSIGILLMVLFAFSFSIADEPKYTNETFARISFLTGTMYIQRASELTYEEAVVNTPVSEGDRIGTTDGRAEIYLGKGNYLRLDNNTKVDFLNMPKKGDLLTQIQVWSGNVFLSVNNLEKEKSIEIHSIDVSVYILNAGLYRLDVRQGSETDIFVFNGIVEAAGSSGSELLQDGQRLEAIDGHFTNRPTRFMAVAEDSFDRWSEYRDTQVRKTMQQTYLPEELQDFENELSEYGEWINIPQYGWVWVPDNQANDWRPYSYGRWYWAPMCGWSWLSYYPWGWAPFHYGRWHWNMGYGWYWIPSSYWGPAWVSWYWGYDYWGWSPLSYYGYPGVIINNRYYGRYSHPDFPNYARTMVVVRKNQLQAKNISNVALHQNEVAKLGKIQFTKNQPNIKPSSEKIAVQKLEGNKVFLKGEKQTFKYKPSQISPNSGRAIKSGSTVRDTRITQDEYLRRIRSPEGERIFRKKTGYPSSPNITLDNVDYRSSRSVFGKIYNYFGGSSKSKSGSRSISSSSSKSKSGSSSKRISSSRSRSGSSRSTSSSRTRTSSGGSKTRKKK